MAQAQESKPCSDAEMQQGADAAIASPESYSSDSEACQSIFTPAATPREIGGSPSPVSGLPHTSSGEAVASPRRGLTAAKAAGITTACSGRPASVNLAPDCSGPLQQGDDTEAAASARRSQKDVSSGHLHSPIEELDAAASSCVNDFVGVRAPLTASRERLDKYGVRAGYPPERRGLASTGTLGFPTYDTRRQQCWCAPGGPATQPIHSVSCDRGKFSGFLPEFSNSQLHASRSVERRPAFDTNGHQLSKCPRFPKTESPNQSARISDAGLLQRRKHHTYLPCQRAVRAEVKEHFDKPLTFEDYESGFPRLTSSFPHNVAGYTTKASENGGVRRHYADDRRDSGAEDVYVNAATFLKAEHRFLATLLELYMGVIGIQGVFTYANTIFANYSGAVISLFLLISACYSHIDRRASAYVMTGALFFFGSILLIIPITTAVHGFDTYHGDSILRAISIGGIPTGLLFSLLNFYLAKRAVSKVCPISTSTLSLAERERLSSIMPRDRTSHDLREEKYRREGFAQGRRVHPAGVEAAANGGPATKASKVPCIRQSVSLDGPHLGQTLAANHGQLQQHEGQLIGAANAGTSGREMLNWSQGAGLVDGAAYMDFNRGYVGQHPGAFRHTRATN